MKERAIPPHLFIVFGGTGDLAKRKLLPAISRISRKAALAGGQQVLAVARHTDYDDESYRAWARESLDGSAEMKEWCNSCLHYHALPDENPDYEGLKRRIEEIEGNHDLPQNRVFYLSVPPRAFPGVIEGLGKAGLDRSDGFTRLVVEKPFGEDLESARSLNALVHRWFDETQIYRIDHYLGKETVQNLLVFRFANSIFEPIWNRDRIDNIQITVAEDIGVGSRAGYYDRVGALRDMVQNHLTQILTLTAMEVPVAYDAESIRHEKVKVLRAVRPIDLRNVVFGRYAPTQVNGETVPGYLDEKNVPPDSQTETYAALKLDIDSWRWQGVPFYLRTGKRLARPLTEIAVSFRRPPVSLFRSLELHEVDEDLLRIILQPDEGFSLHFDVKRPGSPPVLEKIPLAFKYGERFGSLPDPYVTLLLDVVVGDQTLFVHASEVETSWELYEPLLDGSARVHDYDAGTWGPRQADQMIARDGRTWKLGE